MSFYFDHDDDWSAVALESFACLCASTMYVWRFGRGGDDEDFGCFRSERRIEN